MTINRFLGYCLLFLWLLALTAGCRPRTPSSDIHSVADIKLHSGSVLECDYQGLGIVEVEVTRGSPQVHPTERQRLREKLKAEIRMLGGHGALDVTEQFSGEVLTLTGSAFRFVDPDCMR
ncbi:MAG: hypothetical protein ABIF77_03855 [bacterium]